MEKVTYHLVSQGMKAADAIEVPLKIKPSKNDIILLLDISYRVVEVIHDVTNEKVFVAVKVHTEYDYRINSSGNIIKA